MSNDQSEWNNLTLTKINNFYFQLDLYFFNFNQRNDKLVREERHVVDSQSNEDYSGAQVESHTRRKKEGKPKFPHFPLQARFQTPKNERASISRSIHQRGYLRTF